MTIHCLYILGDYEKKIEEDSSNPKYIKTVRGLGYRWNKEVRRN